MDKTFFTPFTLEELREQAQQIGNFMAPDGYVFVCTACGKRSRDKYGDQYISHGWDESCMMHAQLFPEKVLILAPGGNSVVHILTDAEAEERAAFVKRVLDESGDFHAGVSAGETWDVQFMASLKEKKEEGPEG